MAERSRTTEHNKRQRPAGDALSGNAVDKRALRPRAFYSSRRAADQSRAPIPESSQADTFPLREQQSSYIVTDRCSSCLCEADISNLQVRKELQMELLTHAMYGESAD